MKELIKKYWLVAVIVLAVVGIIIFLFSSGNNNNTEQTNNQPTVTPMPTITKITPTAPPAAGVGFGPNSPNDILVPTEQQELSQNEQDYPLNSKLPYKTELFTIDHYKNPRQLVVIVKSEADEAEATIAIDKWLKNYGFDPGSHTIIWETKTP